MKKIVFSIVGSMLISLCVVQAQERDTTGMASKSRNKQNKQQYEQSQQKRDQTRQQGQQAWQQQDDSRNAYANEGMVIIDKDEIPSSLKQTLQEEKYAGWENATIYHNTNTGEYVIAPRAYRFDEQGKEIDMGSTGYGNRDGNQNRNQNQGRYSRDESSGQNMQESPERTAQSQQGQDARGEDQSGQVEREGQQPSSGYRSGQNGQSDTNDESQPGQSSQDYRTEDMTEVQSEQVPASLRRTLSERQYSGWEENGKLYKDPATNDYVLIMEKQDDSSQPRAYRFDKNGQLKEDQSSSGDQNRSGGQSGSSQRNNGQ